MEEQGEVSELEKYPELPVDYSPDTGVLVFSNQEEALRSGEMVENLTAHIGASGLANRFTLENASVILLHHFRNSIDKDDHVATRTGAPGLSA